jgi:hypothetical protein
MEKKRSTYRILVGKPEGRSVLKNLCIDVKMYLHEMWNVLI